MAADTSEELERFRKQWQQEVKARKKAGSSTRPANSKPVAFPPASQPVSGLEDKEHGTGTPVRDGYRAPEDTTISRVTNEDHQVANKEPKSALEHYEKAVEREGNGSLGDSVKHYRTAYRLDAAVDQLYKQKHFPPSSFPSKAPNPDTSNAAVTVPNHHSLEGPSLLPTSELISTFQTSSIIGADPPTDASLAPPCPISSIPSEILVNILNYVAFSDPNFFARLAQVCRRLAFLVTTENRIWREVCEGDTYGFGAMHYTWALTVAGKPLPISVADLDSQMSNVSLALTPRSLSLSPMYPSYRTMFHKRPRVRFNGCYISTVNYIRPGAATASQANWSSPVLIVTYYRYLRFFRDGSCISLLTTTEPSDVVHQLTKDNMHTHHPGGLPSSLMNQALRGRWKLKGNPFRNDKDIEEEGTLDIETEGADADRPEPKYTYKLLLQMRSGSRAPTATRNNKLIWLGFYSYNRLSDDFAEFSLRNDKAFYWSRVKSYGAGE